MGSHLKPTVSRITSKQAIVGLAVLLLCLHPFLLASASPEPYILALPWWYWATVGVFAAIYALCAYLVLDHGANDESGTVAGGDAQDESEVSAHGD